MIDIWEEYHPIVSDDYLLDDSPYRIREEARPNALFQLKKLFVREVKIVLREKSWILATFEQTSLVIILCCIIFFQIDFTTATGFFEALFIVPTNLMFSTVQLLSTVFPLRADKLVGEQYSRTYRPCLLFLACSLVFLPIRLLSAIYFLLLSYWIIGFRSGFQYFLMFMAITLAFNYAVVAIGLMLGSMFRKVIMVQIFGIVILLIFLFFFRWKFKY